MLHVVGDWVAQGFFCGPSQTGTSASSIESSMMPITFDPWPISLFLTVLKAQTHSCFLWGVVVRISPCGHNF